MNEIDPSVNGNTPLSHHLSCTMERDSCTFEVPSTPLFMEHVPVKIFRNIWSVNVCHSPQRPNHATKATKLQRRSEVDGLIGGVVDVDCCTMTSGQECEFGIGQSSLDEVSQHEPLIVVKLKVGKERFVWYQMAMASEMDPVVVRETRK